MRVDAFAKLTLSLRVKGVRRRLPRARRDDGFGGGAARRFRSSPPRISIDVTGPFAADVPADAEPRVARPRRAARRSRSSCTEASAAAGSAAARPTRLLVLAVLGGDEHIARRWAPTYRSASAVARRTARRRRDRALAPPALAVVIATPRPGATAAIYAAWTSSGSVFAPNDLEAAAHHVEPRLVAFKHAIEDAGGRGSSPAAARRTQSRSTTAPQRSRATRITEAIDGWVARPHDRRRRRAEPVMRATTCPAGAASGSSSEASCVSSAHALAALDQRAHDEERRYQKPRSGRAAGTNVDEVRGGVTAAQGPWSPESRFEPSPRASGKGARRMSPRT